MVPGVRELAAHPADHLLGGGHRRDGFQGREEAGALHDELRPDRAGRDGQRVAHERARARRRRIQETSGVTIEARIATPAME